MRYLEDYEPGEIMRFGRYDVSREEMLEFAGKYDPQDFHLDDAAAARSAVFKRMSASGWHTASMMMAMQVATFGPGEPPFVAALGVDQLRWHEPVYAGDVLDCERRVLDARPSGSRPGMGVLRMHTTVRNQNGEPVMTMIAAVLVKRRPAD